MDSFTKFAQSTRGVSGGRYSPKISGGKRGSLEVFGTDTTTFLFATALGLGVLFLILQPGFLVNIPTNSQQNCAKLAPLPAACLGSCNFSTGLYTASASDTICVSGTPATGKLQMDNVCTQQQKCNKFWLSGYTSIPPILVHSVIFLVLLALAGYVVISNRWY